MKKKTLIDHRQKKVVNEFIKNIDEKIIVLRAVGIENSKNLKNHIFLLKH